MKKVNKISLSLGFVGVLMIAVAILLQYKSFQMDQEMKVNLEKVSMKAMATGVAQKVVKDNANTSSDPTQTPTETIEEVDPNENSEVQEITTYEDVQTTPVEPIVFDNLTLNQLAEKLNRSLKSTIADKGYLIASYSLQLGIDPYLATAIILHETGCNSGNCSNLVKSCNNVGGQKGAPGCGGGAYKSYQTLEEGIRGYLDNLYNNYVALGLTTADAMGPRYAASTTWASQVNNYIALIKSK